MRYCSQQFTSRGTMRFLVHGIPQMSNRCMDKHLEEQNFKALTIFFTHMEQ
jgi:hypothetical protein